MEKSILTIAFLLLSITFSAQIKAITEKGDTINVYENGTWIKFKLKSADVIIESNVKTTVTVDQFNKSKNISTENWGGFGEDILKKSISGSLMRVDDLTVFSIFYLGDLGCMSKYSTTMKVKLINGEIIEFCQISDTDCGDFVTVQFMPLTKDQLQDPNFKTLLSDNLKLLKQYDWETIRINGSKYYTDLTPSKSISLEKPEQFFRQHLIAADKE